MRKQITIDDIASQAKLSGQNFGATLLGQKVALTGIREMRPLPLGFTVHTLDARAEQDFTTRAERRAGLVLHVTLEGVIDASLGGHRLDLSRERDMPVRLAYSANRVAMPFRRRACRGDYLRKVNIVVSWDWLAGRGIAAETILGAADFVQGGWLAQPEDVARAERLVTLGTQNPVAARPADILEREALSLALLTRLLGQVCASTSDRALSARDQLRLDRMESFALREGALPDVAAIAAAGGMSVSSARRLFARAYNCTITARMRALRMEQALVGLRAGDTVAEAARLAGFASPESFATAFKQHYGASPSRKRRIA